MSNATPPVIVGKANLNGSSTGTGDRATYYRLGHKTPQDRTLVMRLGPPIGAAAQNGVWRRFIKMHFGYSIPVTTKTGERRNIPQTFVCLEETNRDGLITQECPECNEVRLQKEKLEQVTEELKKQGRTPEEIEAAVKHKKAWLKEHNLDKKWYLLAKDPSHKWGVLTISYSCMKLLKEELENLEAKGMDPLGVEKGVWIRFTRSGTNFNEIKDLPKVEMEDAGEGNFRIKFDTFTDSDYQQLGRLPELHTIGRVLTYDQVQQLVVSGGDETVVRTVMNLPTPSAKTGGTETSAGAAPSVQGTAFTGQNSMAPAGPVIPPTIPAAITSAEIDEEVVLQRQLEALKAKKAAAAAAAASAPKTTSPVQVPGPTPGPTLKSQLEVPMDAFLKQFENK